MILTLLESILLIVNAIAILNEKRFLKKCNIFILLKDGFDTVSSQPGDVNEVVSSKNQVIMMIFTLRSIGKCKDFLLFQMF